MISYANPIMMGSSLAIKVAVNNENGVVVTPTNASWSLLDEQGNVVAGRESIALAPGKAMMIYLRGSDTQLGTGQDYATRSVKVVSQYQIADGSYLDVVDQLSFQIQRI